MTHARTRRGTERSERKRRGGELRTYTAPQLVLSGDMLTSAGLGVGDHVTVHRIRDGEIRVSRSNTE